MWQRWYLNTSVLQCFSTSVPQHRRTSVLLQQYCSTSVLQYNSTPLLSAATGCETLRKFFLLRVWILRAISSCTFREFEANALVETLAVLASFVACWSKAAAMPSLYA